MPLVGRKEPGPAERLASAERLNRNEAFSRNVWRLQGDFAVMNQIKMLRIVTFLKNLLVRPEVLNDRAFNQQRKILRRKVIPKRMPGENIFEFGDFVRMRTRNGTRQVARPVSTITATTSSK